MRFEPEKFKDKTGCVLGLGRSGLAAANLLANRGFSVLVSDSRPKDKLAAELRKLHYHVQVEAGGHSQRVYKCAFLVKSPGIPSHAPVLLEAKRRGIPVFSELEVALAFAPTDRVFAVTGTNGKTTTTRLLGDILKAAGMRVHVGGNIGVAVADLVQNVCVGDALVLEVSSYQLEDSRYFHPRVACLLNITPDHYEHHGSHEAYAAAKARIFREMDKTDACVFNASDAQVLALSKHCKGKRLYFEAPSPAASPSTSPVGGGRAWVERGKIRVKLGAKAYSFQPPELPGAHNLENSMAAGLAALAGGVSAEAVQRGFDGFKGVEHRIEPVAKVRGIACVNDSKATNVDSTLVALKSFPKKRNLLLILGGLDKGAPYAPLASEIAAKVRTIYTIGSAADKIERELGAAAPVVSCGTLAKAVETALSQGKSGDTLLLSPACASFDQFKDFEDRGRRFKELVHEQLGRQAAVR